MTKRFCASPLVFRDNKFITDFREKAELFYTLFGEQFLLSKNNTELPNNFLFLRVELLSNIQMSNDNMIKVMHNLDSNKAHGHNMISIRMLKLSSSSF